LPGHHDIGFTRSAKRVLETDIMRYAIHPIWTTTQRPQTLRYGLYQICQQGEVEIARAIRLSTIENLRQQLICHSKPK
jgi:hypothetical protein